MIRRLERALGALAVLLLIGAAHAQAQYPLIIVAGPTFATTSHHDANSKTGFFVAAGTSVPINETFAIEGFAAYVQKGAKFEDAEDDYSEDFSKNVLEIPIFLAANIPVSESVMLGLSVGPQFSFDLSCEADVEGIGVFDCDEDDDYKSTEFGIFGAAGLGFPVGENMQLYLGVGADFGLTAIFDNDDENEKTRTYSAYAALGIPIGG